MRFVIRVPVHRTFDESPGTLKLVKAAKRVFARSGGSAFSIRNVAKQARMSVGALQHYYPTRDKLLAAMLEYVVNEYDVAYQRVFGSLQSNGEARLMAVLDYLTRDLCNQETRGFFFSLWALGCHSRFAAALIDESYLHHRHNLASFIAAARPAFSRDQCFHAATAVAAMLEGLMIFTGSGMKHALDQTALTSIVRAAVVRLLSDGFPENLYSGSCDSDAQDSRIQSEMPVSRKHKERIDAADEPQKIPGK